MDLSAIDAAGQAFLIMMEPHRLMFLGLGVVMGLVLGILPGIGTTAGVAILLPFTFGVDPYSAFALLLGLASVTATGDPIPAILFGVPGGAGSAATVLDGQPMARRGEAGRALSAAYMSSLLGGLVGAALLFLTIPILRTFILWVGAPQLLAFAVFGISMVAILAGNSPLKGLCAGCLGVILSMVGNNPQTGVSRYTFDTLYLWDGLPLVAVVLGFFALPELCELAVNRASVTGSVKYDVKSGKIKGAMDCVRNWWLILRCSVAGTALGTIPGITGGVVDWLMYGYAAKTEKGAKETFGKGDVRGVIAVESSNNSKEAGQLVPAIALGVPTTSSMALLIGAFFSRGLVPGPEMLTKHLDLTYSMVWSMALANILGAGICYAMSGQFARLSTLRYTLILPGILTIIYVGAFESSRQWGDLYTLLGFGLLGWAMKQLKWARPPLLLGFVLGPMIERYLFISTQRYGWQWAIDPVVIILFAIALWLFIQPGIKIIRRTLKARQAGNLSAAISPRFRPENLLHILVVAVFAYAVGAAWTWDYNSRVVPLAIASVGLSISVLSLIISVLFSQGKAMTAAELAEHEVEEEMHLDLESATGDLPPRTVLFRSMRFYGWLVVFMISIATIGFVMTVPLFVVTFMWLENREPWYLMVPQAIALTLFIHYVFGHLLGVPWPATLLGSLVPSLVGVIPGV